MKFNRYWTCWAPAESTFLPRVFTSQIDQIVVQLLYSPLSPVSLRMALYRAATSSTSDKNMYLHFLPIISCTMDRKRRIYQLASTNFRLNNTDFFHWVIMKSVEYESPVKTELLGRVMAASLHIRTFSNGYETWKKGSIYVTKTSFRNYIIILIWFVIK